MCLWAAGCAELQRESCVGDREQRERERERERERGGSRSSGGAVSWSAQTQCSVLQPASMARRLHWDGRALLDVIHADRR